MKLALLTTITCNMAAVAHATDGIRGVVRTDYFVKKAQAYDTNPQKDSAVVSNSSQAKAKVEDDPCQLCPEGQVLSNPDYVFDTENEMTCILAYYQIQEDTVNSELEDSEACVRAKAGFDESGCLCTPEGAQVDASYVRMIHYF